MTIDLRTAIVFALIGLGEGALLMDWWHTKQEVKKLRDKK